MRALLFKIGILILTGAFATYFYIEASNGLIETQLAIPELQKELRALQMANERLQYEIDQFESPLHLMELARKPEFSHLKPSFYKDVIEVPYGNKLP